MLENTFYLLIIPAILLVPAFCFKDAAKNLFKAITIIFVIFAVIILASHTFMEVHGASQPKNVFDEQLTSHFKPTY